MVVLEFIFSSFWTFIGSWILFSVACNCLVGIFKVIYCIITKRDILEVMNYKKNFDTLEENLKKYIDAQIKEIKK